MTCDCTSWARLDGRMTNHHPDCEHFKEERYVKITLDGGGTYVQAENDLSVLLAEIAESEPGSKWTLELIEMTAEEYAALPEFEGH